LKKIIGFIICTLLITTTGFSAIGFKENDSKINDKYKQSTFEQQSQSESLFEWTMFRHDLNNTGFSPSLAPDDNNVLWSKYIGDWVDSNPTIKDERLYIVGDNYNYQGGANLWCLNPFTGAEIWTTNIPDEFVWGSPTVANDRVYVLGTYFNLYCYDANNGDLLWDFESNGHCGPMVVEDKLYFGCNAGDYKGFYCLNATTGEIIWLHDPATSYPGCTPAIVNGKVYVGNGDGDLYCLNAETGDEIWSQNRCYQAAPSVFNNRVYTHYDKIYCLDAENGDEIWNYPNLDNYCSTAIAYGNVYTGSRDGSVYCLDAETGDLNWQSLSLGYICNDVAVADNKVFIPVGGHETLSKLVCLDAFTGEVLWEYPLGGMYCIYSAPAVAYGNVYVGAGENGYIFAFGTNQPPEKPISPDGPSEGFIGVEYTFNSSTNDPGGYELYYLFDWGDGTLTFSDWVGPYKSGEYVEAVHTWENIGVYNVRVKAKDEYNSESNWSEPHTITIMNRPIIEIGQISGGFLKVKVDIKNIGDIDANDVNWSITLKGGAFIGKKTESTDLNVIAGESETITSKLIFGFGPTVITVNAWIPESSDKREQSGFVLLFFIKINPGG